MKLNRIRQDITHDKIRGTFFYWLALSIAVALGICVYSNTIFGFFLSDDFPQVHQCLISGFHSLIPSGGVKFLRPMMSLSLLFDVNLWELNAVGYHCTNLVLHLGASIMTGYAMWLFLRFLSSDTPSKWTAWCAAIVFLFMPCHSEPVAWISGRVDLLATFFALASLCAYLSSLRFVRWFWYPLSLSLFFFALLSKESVLIFPFIVLVIRLLVNDTVICDGYLQRGKAAGIIGFFVVLGLYLVIRYVALGTLVGGYGDRIHTNLNIGTIISVICKSPVKALFPLQLLKQLPIREWMLAPVGAFVLVLTGGTVWTVWWKNAGKSRWGDWLLRRPEIAVLISSGPLFLAALVPVANLSVSINTMGSDRYLYFPSVFAAFFLAAALDLCISNTRIRALSFAAIIGIYGVSLYRLNENWRTAADIAHNIVRDLCASPPSGPILIANMPDNYNDAYIFRNGLIDAVAMFHSTVVARNIKVISFQSLNSVGSGADLSCNAQGCSVMFRESTYGPLHYPYSFWINGGRPGDANEAAELSAKGTFSTDSYRIFDVWDCGFNFVAIGDMRKTPNVFCYTDGRLIPAPGDAGRHTAEETGALVSMNAYNPAKGR